MIELKNLTKKYGTIAAVENVSLSIERNSLTAIVGPSGSGKTTLLRLIAGLEIPDSGEILIDDQPASITGKIIIPPHRRNLGMIFQDLALWPHMKILDNLEFGLKSLGIKKNLRKEKILNLIKLDNHLNRYPPYLSGGEKQRVALARTLILEPAILLMDEPLSNIDPMLKDDLLEMIDKLVKRLKVTLLYVTHHREEAVSVATDIAVMFKGRIEQTGKLSDLLEKPKTDFVKRFFRER